MYGKNNRNEITTTMIPQKYTNRAQQGAYKKGWTAAKEGKECKSPYNDKGGYKIGFFCFVETFVRAWYKGYDDAKAQSETR